MTTTAKGLIRIARAIGRWILRRLIRKGIDLVVGYMDGKIDDFQRRKGRARTQRRVRWLAGRIRRWKAALRWLIRQRRSITRRIVELVDREVGHAIPMAANDERYERWARRQRGSSREARKRRGRRAA